MTRISVAHHPELTPEGALEVFRRHLDDRYDYEDGHPGELFIKVGKEGSTLRGLFDVIGVQISYALQYGLPLETIGERLTGIAFEPAGATDNPDIPECSSIVDYVYRWLVKHPTPTL